MFRKVLVLLFFVLPFEIAYAQQSTLVVELRHIGDCFKCSIVSAIISDSLRAAQIPFAAATPCALRKHAAKLQRQEKMYDTVYCLDEFSKGLDRKWEPATRILIVSAAGTILGAINVEQYLEQGWPLVREHLERLGAYRRR